MNCPRCDNPVGETERFCSQCGFPLVAGEIDESEFGPSSPSVQTQALASVGQVIDGRYRLRYLIGIGGMGAVYRAEVLGLGHSVALKILHPTMSADSVSRRRFENEARLASQIDHPNIVSILDYRSSPSLTYLVMEHLSGQALSEVLSAIGYLGVQRSIHITRQLLSALEAAHRLKVLHRDLKPENIFLIARHDQLDHVKVLDFGMATDDTPQRLRLTQQGHVCGTPAYMSPEQAQGQPIDHRSDLYAVGIVLYECLTGVNPFVGVTTADALMNQINVSPSRPSQVRKKARIPPYLDALVMRALNKDPDDRFSSAAEFRQVLEGLVLARQQGSGETSAVRACEQCGRPLMAGDQRCEGCGEPLASDAPGGYQTLLTPEFVHALEKRAPDEIELELSPTSTVTACPSVGWDPPLVGLQREQQTITGLLTRQRSFLRIVGPPGSGKGRLARETARQAAQRDWQVIWIEPEIQPAYGSLHPIQQAASRLLQLPDSWLTEDDLMQSAARIDFDPRHEQGFKDLFGFPMPQESADSRRARRAEAWRAVVRGAARQRPLLLVFFDLDCVDGPSQELVASLAADEQSTEHPLHVIITQDRDLMLLWPETSLINLQPLSREEAAKLAQQLLESSGGDFSPASVVDASLGNPLMLIELTRLATVDPQARFPKHVAEVVNRRMSYLPPRARNLLHAMAVAGRVSSPQTLLSMIDEPEAGAGALSLLGEQGFMMISGSGWRPAHRVHGEVAYASTPAAVRTKLHQQAASLALEEGAPAAQVAHHLFAAGDREQAVPYLLRAGWQALEALDDALATKQFNRVLQIVPAPPKTFGSQTEPWVLANLGLSTALADGGDLDAALQLLRGAVKTASDAGWSDEVGRFEQYQEQLRRRR